MASGGWPPSSSSRPATTSSARRDRRRADDAIWAAPGAVGVLVADLASIGETRGVADQANAAGRFDAVIHNAAVGFRERRIETVDGLAHVFAINVLAPYLLTALIAAPLGSCT